MFTATRSLALAFVAAFALTACGGGAGRSAAPPVAKTDLGQHRKAMSVPCTPDSYGYCYTVVSRNLTSYRCSQFETIQNGTVTFEVYDSTSDLGTYVETVEQACGDVPMWSWDPGEPSVVYSDPNLP